MSTNKVFKYNDFEVECDLSDYLVAEKWENALEAYESRRKELAAIEKPKTSEVMKNLVLAIADFLDLAFGEGACNEILGDTTSLDKAIDAFNAAQQFSIIQNAETSQKWKTLVVEFDPKNRAQRRAK